MDTLKPRGLFYFGLVFVFVTLTVEQQPRLSTGGLRALRYLACFLEARQDGVGKGFVGGKHRHESGAKLKVVFRGGRRKNGAPSMVCIHPEERGFSLFGFEALCWAASRCGGS